MPQNTKKKERNIHVVMYNGKLYMEFIVYTVIGLWGFMVFNATFNNIFQLYRGGQFCW